MSVVELQAEAARLGHRLVASAQWNGHTCAWSITKPGRGRAATPAVELCGADLYQGAAGVALFLTALYRTTKVDSFASTAEGALRHAVAAIASSPGLGFYSGRAGLAWATAHFAAATGSNEWRDVALHQLDSIGPLITTDRTLDIIGGAAGAVLAATVLPRLLDATPRTDLLEALGNHIIRFATRRTIGWSWSSGGISCKQHLCGYAHGTSGMAHAMLELYAYDGTAKWKYAAERAIAYERSQRILGTNDWPDYRCNALSEILVLPEGNSMLREHLRSGLPGPAWNSRAMRAWCHGAPGIALTRLRAVSLDVDRTSCLEEAHAAVAATRTSIFDSGTLSESLCHGAIGNMTTLLLAARTLSVGNEVDLRESLLKRVRTIGARGGAWPSGNVGGCPDPSLMLGDAGIGHALLEFCDSKILSALFPCSWSSASFSACSIEEERRKDWDHMLPHTSAIMQCKGSSDAERVPETRDMQAFTTLDDAHAHIEDLIETERHRDESYSLVLEEAFSLDVARIKMEDRFDDYLKQYYSEVARVPSKEIDLVSMRWILSTSVTIVETKREWYQWPRSRASIPSPGNTATVTFQQAQGVRFEHLSPVQYVTLLSLGVGASITETVETIATNNEIDISALAALQEFVTTLAARWHDAGILECAPRESNS